MNAEADTPAAANVPATVNADLSALVIAAKLAVMVALWPDAVNAAIVAVLPLDAVLLEMELRQPSWTPAAAEHLAGLQFGCAQVLW